MDVLLQLFWVETDLYLLQGSAQVLELFHRGRSYNVYVVLQLDQVGLGDQLIVTWMEFLQLFNHFCVLGCKDNKLPNVLISAGKMLFLITSLFLGLRWISAAVYAGLAAGTSQDVDRFISRHLQRLFLFLQSWLGCWQRHQVRREAAVEWIGVRRSEVLKLACTAAFLRT